MAAADAQYSPRAPSTVQSNHSAAAEAWARAKSDLLDAQRQAEDASQTLERAVAAEFHAWRDLESHSGRSVAQEVAGSAMESKSFAGLVGANLVSGRR